MKEKTCVYSARGVPCQEPPFGTVNAIDLSTGEVAWTQPAGTLRDAHLMAIKMHMPMPVGLPTIGGSMAPQRGLLFFAAIQADDLRAYDSPSGDELWKGRRLVGSQSTPITYVSPEDGHQYVLISAGGARNSPDQGAT